MGYFEAKDFLNIDKINEFANQKYEQGRADQKEEDNAFFNFEGAWKLEKKKVRADAIDECKYKIVDSLEKQLGCKVCSSYEEKYHCSKCKMQEIINLTVDILEQLKEQSK